MKKIIIVCSLGLVLGAAGSAWAAEGCTLNMISGDAKVMRDGKMMSVQEKDVLNKGDMLQTGPNGMTDMSMNDLAGCRVLPGSKVNVMGWKPENMALSVLEGNVILKVKLLPRESSFKVETPTAIATVRGTQFWGRVENSAPDNPVTTFAVRRGIVEILDKASSNTFQVRSGQALDIPKKAGGELSLRKALSEELKAMEQAEAIPTETE